MHIQLFFIVVGELRFKELVDQILVILSNGFGNSLCVILARTDVADRETIHEPRYQTAATKNGIVNHTAEHIRLTRKTDAHVRLFQHNTRSGRSVADVGLAVPRVQQNIKIRHIVAVASAEITEDRKSVV